MKRGGWKQTPESNARRAIAHFKHGEAPNRHGKKATTEYCAWLSMKARCAYNQRYIRNGTTVCRRWLRSYAAFLADMGRRPSSQHSLDRINTYGHYTPANCRWASKSEQANNHRPYMHKTYCKRGHLRTARNVTRQGACKQCLVLWYRARKGATK